MSLTRIVATVGGMIVLSGMGGCPPPPTGPANMTGYQVVTGPKQKLGPRGTATQTAICPQGKVVTAGGYNADRDAANIFDNAPTTDGSGWIVSAQNDALIGPDVNFSPIAICVNRPQGYAVRSASTNLSAQQIGSAEPRCQDASFGLLGGGYLTNDSMVHPFTSTFGTNAQPSWIGTFKSNYAGVPSNSLVTTFAICADLLQVPGRAEVSHVFNAVGYGGNVTMLVSCPPGTKVLSGGVVSDVSAARWYASGTNLTNDTWLVSLENTTSVFDQNTVHPTLFAVCANAVP